MQLKTVVLPAPFGPISAVMSLRAALKERSPMAMRPPKRIVRCSTRSSGSLSRAISAVTLCDEFGRDRLLLSKEDRRLARRDEPARTPSHDQDHGDADCEHAVLGGIES